MVYDDVRASLSVNHRMRLEDHDFVYWWWLPFQPLEKWKVHIVCLHSGFFLLA